MAVELIKDEENPIAVEVMEQAILDIAAGMKRLNGTRLKREVIVRLIHAKTTVRMRDIEAVLNSLDSLEETWLKPKEKNGQ
jgi:hypothetical protein